MALMVVTACAFAACSSDGPDATRGSANTVDSENTSEAEPASTADSSAPPPTGASTGDTATAPTEAVGADAGANTAATSGLGFDETHVTVHLQRSFDGPSVIAFGVPLAPGRLTDASAVSVTAAGQPLDVKVAPTLSWYDGSGHPTSLRAIQLQLPASVLTADSMDLDVAFSGGSASGDGMVPFADASVESIETARVADYTITDDGGTAVIEASNERDVELFTAREPAVAVQFPPGYLASTGLLGRQLLPDDPAAAELGGLKFITEAITPFGLSAMHVSDYPLNPDSVIIPDAQENYEAWLYDRCATFILFYTYTNDLRFLRESYRVCSYYADAIGLSGDNLGIWTGKAERDTKYSHLRGLFAYFALTGDEAAQKAGTAIADMWSMDPDFVVPYADGHIRSNDSLWTERLLGVSMEGLVFGYALAGDTKYLDVFSDLMDTAYAHITGDAATLAKINPGNAPFPPQNCFVHTAEQHAEGNADEPWCSGWMVELLLPGLLEYQTMTSDDRVDDIFVRLTRFLRDVGTSYFKSDRIDDMFLEPQVAYDPDDSEDPRLLTPLYGAGINVDGSRHNEGEFDDFQHCIDGTALVAAGIRGRKRQGVYDDNPIGPFASEGESFVAMENELLFCAQYTFTDQSRPHRNPSNWTAEELQEGLGDPKQFVLDNKIGFPSYNNEPERRISWWFNSGLFAFGLLAEAGVDFAAITPGAVQP